MEGHFLTIGKIINVRGLQGEVKVFSTTDFPEARFKKGNVVYLYDGKNDDRIEVTITQVNFVKGYFFLKLKGIDTIEAAEKIINWYLQAPKKESFLNQDQFYYDDLENCKVYDEGRSFIGIVKKVEAYSAQHSLRIMRDQKKDVLIPFVKAFIKHVDIHLKEITVHVIDGLL